MSCKKCVLTEHFPNIKIDEMGICNYCKTYDHFKNRIEDVETNHKLFLKRIEQIKGKNEYDCLVGISGGKDSSYILDRLKNHYKLNVLGYTFDNGYMTNYAKDNIKTILEKIDVDYFTYKPNWDFQKTFYKKMLELTGIPCKACSLGMYGTSFKFAFEKNIPLVMHGRSPAQMFRELTSESTDPFVPFIQHNLTEYNKEKQIQTLIMVLEKIVGLFTKYSADPSFINEVKTKFFPDVKKVMVAEQVPEFLGYFIYHHYDENKIKDYLEKNLDWKRMEKDRLLSHGDCYIHDAVEYLRLKNHGYTMGVPEFSVQIRQGKIKKEEALKLIEKEKREVVWPEESMEILCKTLDLNCKKFKKSG